MPYLYLYRRVAQFVFRFCLYSLSKRKANVLLKSNMLYIILNPSFVRSCIVVRKTQVKILFLWVYSL